MGYALELYFDRETEEKIIDLWEKLHSVTSLLFEIKSRPHISLAVYNDKLPEDHFLKTFRMFAMPPLSLTLSYIGAFPGVVFLGPNMTKTLLKIHRDCYNFFKFYKSFESNYYFPQHWVPHCTMGLDLQEYQTPSVLKILEDNFKPLRVKITELAFIKFRPCVSLAAIGLKKK